MTLYCINLPFQHTQLTVGTEKLGSFRFSLKFPKTNNTTSSLRFQNKNKAWSQKQTQRMLCNTYKLWYRANKSGKEPVTDQQT